jgi:KDO2-lipid IV(A) lauroyltransferase
VTLAELRRSGALLVARPFFALALVLGRFLPPRLLLRLAQACSRAVFALFPGVRRNLLENARHILGNDSSLAERQRLSCEILASFARFIVEWVAPRAVPEPQRIHERSHGREHLEAAVAAGKGVVSVTLHIGNYELAARELAAHGYDVAIVFNRERVGFLERLRSRARRAKRLDEVVIEDSPFFGIEVYRRVRRGGIVLLAADQVGAPDAERFPFLHGEARFSMWPARLASASGAPLLPAFCVRGEDGAYRLEVAAPIRAEGREPREVTQELIGVLEEHLRRAPGQWLMVHDFWSG